MTDRTGQATGTDDGVEVFRDAEAFLADLGVERRPIVLRDAEGEADATDGDGGPRTLEDAAAPLVGTADAGSTAAGDTPDDDEGAPVSAPVSAAEAARLVAETVPPDEVTTAVAYIRRSTAAQPASEGRLRGRLAERGHDADVVEAALARARAERLVDDDALSAALVAEWRAKGHAPRRIRADLRRREFDEQVIDRAVGEVDQQDHLAMAFELARQRAESLGHLPPETAYRRVAGYVARRGYGEGVARKAARDAVYDQRADERTAGR